MESALSIIVAQYAEMSSVLSIFYLHEGTKNPGREVRSGKSYQNLVGISDPIIFTPL